MLHTRNTLEVETKEILRAITIFKALEHEQAIKLLYDKEQTASVILRNLCKQGHIYYDANAGIVADSQKSADSPDTAMLKAFWVLLEFNNKAEYYNTGDYPALISFFANEEHYEIIYAAHGNEVAFNFVLTKSGDNAKRLVIIDSSEQIAKLKVPNLLCFCTVANNGAVQFFKIE